MVPERDMLSLRDGVGPGLDGKFFRRRRRRRLRRPLKKDVFFGKRFLHDWASEQRWRRDTAGKLIVMTSRIFFTLIKNEKSVKMPKGRGPGPGPGPFGPWAQALLGPGPFSALFGPGPGPMGPGPCRGPGPGPGPGLVPGPGPRPWPMSVHFL